MSSPMFELPKHLPISVDANGNGPAEGPAIDRVICWCGVENCTRYEEDWDDVDEVTP